MNFAVILAGGVGTRMGSDIPKQYICVEGKPVLVYTLERFQACPDIDKIVIVADEAWRADIQNWAKQYNIEKFLDFATPGATRQDSVYSGLSCCIRYAQSSTDIVAVHDSARALISVELISKLVQGVEGYDGCIPVMPLKDAVFYSAGGQIIEKLVNRNELFCTQAPECFYLQPYWELNNATPASVRSTALADHELAFQNGWRIHCCPSEENNFKLTTPGDIDRMISLLRTGKA